MLSVLRSIGHNAFRMSEQMHICFPSGSWKVKHRWCMQYGYMYRESHNGGATTGSAYPCTDCNIMICFMTAMKEPQSTVSMMPVVEAYQSQSMCGNGGFASCEYGLMEGV